MMFETLILLAAAAAPAQAAPDCEQTAVQAPPSTDPGLIEMSYNAFVAVEETPSLKYMIRPAIAAATDKPSAIDRAAGTASIS